MISMRSLKKACRVSNPEGVAALFFSGLIGLSMVVLIPEKDFTKPIHGMVVEAADTIPSSVLFETPEAVAESGKIDMEPVDLEKLVNFCIAHTTSSRSFVVFRNGTCALVQEPCRDPVQEARTILKGCAEPEGRFLSERTAEGDLVVTFKGSVFHWIPGSDIQSLEDWSLANASMLLSDKEREAAAPGWVPPANARLGLVARKRLLEDSESAEVVKILRPNTAVAKIDR